MSLPTIDVTPATYAGGQSWVRTDPDEVLRVCAEWFGIQPVPEDVFPACYQAHAGSPGPLVATAASNWDPKIATPDYVIITAMRIRHAQRTA